MDLQQFQRRDGVPIPCKEAALSNDPDRHFIKHFLRTTILANNYILYELSRTYTT